MAPMIRMQLKGIISFNWKLGFALILIFGVIRFLIVTYSIQTGDNKYLSFIFLLMILMPFILLNKEGRKSIGIQKIRHLKWIFYAFLLAAVSCGFMHLVGDSLFGSDISNWFRYIGESYPIDLTAIDSEDKLVYFVIFALIGMTFSPFGEELMYRGVIHGSLVPKFGERNAAIIDSAAFGITHLAHFGLVYYEGSWQFLTIPALLWVIFIFFTGLLFNFCKTKTGSIWGAVIAHMAFNITMTYFIFYHIF
ncbi:MAG: CPBP family intramembrane metalloprotease [Bacteroidia bacterium]|nr:CPBP family intramembrane metalloprotease [Bacteroidia bacterium]